MIADIGNIIINKINTLPFIDKYAGVVRVVKFKQANNTVGSFPVDCQISLDDCTKGKRYLDLCPDSKKKSVIYLEDSNLRQVYKRGEIQKYTAVYNLIGWLNLPLLGFTGCSYSAIAIGAILKNITVPPFHESIYQYIDIKFLGQQSKQVDPFSKYSYDETINQHLMYPYDHFVLTLEVDFQFNTRCITTAVLNPPNECLIK